MRYVIWDICRKISDLVQGIRSKVINISCKKYDFGFDNFGLDFASVEIIIEWKILQI